MYGTRNRIPRDIDMVIFTARDPEEIKRILVDSDKRKFFLVPSKKRDETYKVLWFRLSGRNPHPSDPSKTVGRRCKVDILIPGTLDLPSIPRTRVCYTRVPDVPVVPLIVLIGLKLRGWVDHRDAELEYYRAKQVDDVADLEALLVIAVGAGISMKDADWLPRQFRKDARERARDFVRFRPATKARFEALGFDMQGVFMEQAPVLYTGVAILVPN